jgi:hypothetical protein
MLLCESLRIVISSPVPQLLPALWLKQPVKEGVNRHYFGLKDRA